MQADAFSDGDWLSVQLQLILVSFLLKTGWLAIQRELRWAARASKTD